MRRVRVFGGAVAVFAAVGGAFAFQIPEESALDRRAIPDPSLVLSQAPVDVDNLAKASGARVGWDRFRAERAGAWRVVLDGPAGVPLLVEGTGIPWSVRPSLETLPALESSLRAFAAGHRELLGADDAELVLDAEATVPLGPDSFQVVFGRAVRGVPVRGDRYIFLFGHENLVAFGASRWTPVDAGIVPRLDAEAAVEVIAAYGGAATRAEVELLVPPHLELVPRAGAGRSSALVWSLVLSFPGERGTWVGLVDAHGGEVRAFFDDTRYAQVKGGIQPESGDGLCPSGCQQPNYPMPFARVTVNGTPVTANAMGQFSCQPPGALATTDLSGPTVRVSDACGAVVETVTCDGDIDLGAPEGGNCDVAQGASAGNTKASRSCFYAVTRLKEHARAWWSTTNAWLSNVQTTVNSNVNSSCNAYWDGSLNMFREGSGCGNTCEAVGVAQHEWGHGMDQNDGGGFDNPSEAYADISEFLTDHTSCVGRGFFTSGTCGGYGDSCLTCSGIRDMDWAARTANTPATPAGFVRHHCPAGGGPCGREEHCEAYVAGETIWDLAARDLPAAGLDQASAWQLTDRLWYRSRPGSGGNMYTCNFSTIPSSNGCSASSLFSRIRLADDDDGNLLNGTPHGAAIFAAFNRHGIACGLAGDPSNQSTTVCPALAPPAVTANVGQNQVVQLGWAAVPGAASYRILRNDIACDYASTIVATVSAPGTAHVDTGLPNDFPLYYRVQAVGTNAACESPVSGCVQATPQIVGPYAVSGAPQLLLDACVGGGAGGNGQWDTGETVRLSLPLTNIGSQTLTNLQAAISTGTPGVEILDGTAAYPDIPPGGTAGALSPYFTLKLTSGIACGTVIPFDVQMTATGGSWTGFFSQRMGGTASATPLNESFSSGIPPTWTVVNGGFGGGPAATWTTANPGGRTFTAPLTAPVAIVDSNFAGLSSSQDEQLITPAMNLAASTQVTLRFDHYFRWLEGNNNERADVDVRSSATQNGWVNVLRFTGADVQEDRSINISAEAAGATNVQVRFRYWLGSNEWWWEVDNVRMDATKPVCTGIACQASPLPKPVAGLQASRAAADGSAIDVTWTVAGCSSPQHEILFGSLSGLSTYAVDGSVCGIGNSGSTTWSGVPAGNLWFVVVGSDGAGTEGSWGDGPGGAPRKGGDASGRCGNVFRNNAGTCP